jgi:hypothetical protein
MAEVGAIVATSVPFAVIVPFLFIRLIAAAQNACFEVQAGQGFYLMVTWFELVAVGWVLFWVGALVTWRRRLRVRLVTGLALVLALCLFATWRLVPWGPSTDYPTAAAAECGPGGVPTWWPPILPHH